MRPADCAFFFIASIIFIAPLLALTTKILLSLRSALNPETIGLVRGECAILRSARRAGDRT
jgi:hypothetical protein